MPFINDNDISVEKVKRVLILSVGLYFYLNPMNVLAQKKPRFVGTIGCACHSVEINSWSRSSHKKAFKLLKLQNRKLKRIKAMKKAGVDPEKDYTADKKCLKCHTTGFKSKGGFVSIEKTPELIGIGCEMCHGPGSEYRELHIENKFTRADAMEAGQIFPAEENPCAECHEAKDNPYKANVDKKYIFVLEERIKKEKSFHKINSLIKKR